MMKGKLSETEQMELDFSMMPALPEEFDQTVDEMVSETRRLFYKRKGNKASYHCTHCGKDYTLRVGNNPYWEMVYSGHERRIEGKIPVEGEFDKCKYCGTEEMLKPVRRWKYDYTWRNLYTWQAYQDGIIERVFEIKKVDSIETKENVEIKELSRRFYTLKSVRCYELKWHYYVNDNGSHCDFDRVNRKAVNSFPVDAVIGNPMELYKNTPLRYCPFKEMHTLFYRRLYTEEPTKAYEHILMTYCHFPEIEMEIKFGMMNIAEYHIMRKGVDAKMNKRKKKPADIYKVYPDRVKELKDCNVSKWAVYQYERENGLRLSDEEVSFLQENFSSGRKNYIDNLIKYMSLAQLMNRLDKYKKQQHGKEEYTNFGVLMHYSDYLDMRRDLGYDMTNSVYLYPRNLRKAHDKMLKEKQDRRNELRVKEVLLKYTNIPNRFKYLKKKYGFSAHGFIIRPAKDAGEIVREGWALHHCVGGNGYLKKHNDGETSILFMRPEDKPDKSYVTIEVKGGNILQWYAAHDKKNVTKEAKACIDEFEQKIKKKIKAAGQKAEQEALLLAAV